EREEIDPLSEGVEISSEIADALRGFASREPLLQGQAVSSDGTVATVLMWIRDDVQEAVLIERFDDLLHQELERVELPRGVRVELGGIPRVRVDVVRSLRREQIVFIPVTAALFFVLLFWLFRRPAGAILPLITVGIAVISVIAVMILLGKPINIINNILPVMLFVIGISDSVHMLTRQAEEMEQGHDKREAIRRMIAHTGAACLLTSTTTAVGFASLVIADTDILKDFGWEAALGVMFAYVATLLFLPSAMSYLRPVVRAKRDDTATLDPMNQEDMAGAPFIERGTVALGRAVLDNPVLTIVVCLVVTAGFVWQASKVEIDTTLLEIYNEDHPTVATTKLMEDKLGGTLPVEVSVAYSERDHFKRPEPFAALHAFQRYAAQRDDVLHTQSMVDFHQAARAALLADQEQRGVMPETRAQIEQLHVLIEGPPDQRVGVRAFITGDFRTARVLLRVPDLGAKHMIGMGEDLRAKLGELFPAEDGYEVVITGDAYVASIALDSFIRDLLGSLLLAIVIIFGMMTVVFRSLTLGLISVVPNLTPLVLTFGYMGWAGIDLNTTTVIIFAVSLGLAVDDTIHFLARFREEEERRDSVYDALVYTFFGAGRAILLTSVLLLLGLSIVMFSSFKPSAFFGRLTGITIAGAIFGDLLLLPPILLLVYKLKGRDVSPSR
ncbi:MAG: efflux RND transporter permease subunit, partial [Myxococcota bacterium]